MSVSKQSSCLQRDSQKILTHSSSTCSRSFVPPVLWGHGDIQPCFWNPSPKPPHALGAVVSEYWQWENCELALWKLILLTLYPLCKAKGDEFTELLTNTLFHHLLQLQRCYQLFFSVPLPLHSFCSKKTGQTGQNCIFFFHAWNLFPCRKLSLFVEV